MMFYSFLFRGDIKESFSNGFLVFVLTDLIWLAACFIFIASFLSYLFSFFYFLVRADPGLKKISGNMFSFFIWDEIKK